MAVDSALLEEMKLQTEYPNPADRAYDPRKDPNKIVRAKLTLNKSKFTEESLGAPGEKVWVKCISELQPWANEMPMQFWEDYLVFANEAILLEERRFAVILKTL